MMCSLTASVDVFIVLSVFHSEGLPRHILMREPFTCAAGMLVYRVSGG